MREWRIKDQYSLLPAAKAAFAKLRRVKGDDLIRREMFFKNCKPTKIESRKTNQLINANIFSSIKREAIAFANFLVNPKVSFNYNNVA